MLTAAAAPDQAESQNPEESVVPAEHLENTDECPQITQTTQNSNTQYSPHEKSMHLSPDLGSRVFLTNSGLFFLRGLRDLRAPPLSTSAGHRAFFSEHRADAVPPGGSCH